MSLKCAGSSVSMSVSHATTSVRLSCASERTGRKAAPPSAAAPAVAFRNDRRSIRLLMLGVLLVSGSFRNRLGPEEDVLRPLEVVLVELAQQLLPCRRGEVLLVLIDVLDLDPLDVVPARALGAVDGPLDPMRRVALDAGQRIRHAVVVLAQPLLVGSGVDALLERRDHVPHLHRGLPFISRRRRVRSSPAGRPPAGRGPAHTRYCSRRPAKCRARLRARRAGSRCWCLAPRPSSCGRGLPA